MYTYYMYVCMSAHVYILAYNVSIYVYTLYTYTVSRVLQGSLTRRSAGHMRRTAHSARST